MGIVRRYAAGERVSGNREKALRIFFATVLVLMFMLLARALLNHRINHEFPSTMLSINHLFYLSSTEAAIEQGHYRWLPGYLNLGFERSFTQMPPGVIHLSALVAEFTGIEPYDVLGFMFIALFILLPVPFIALLSRYPWPIPFAAVALLPFLLRKNFIYGIGHGYYGFILGTLFMFWFLFLFFTRQLRHPVVYGFTLAAMMLSHPPEFFLTLLFLIGYWGVHFAKRKFTLREAVRGYRFWVFTIGVALILSSFYVMVFLVGTFPAAGMNPASYLPQVVTPDTLFPEFIARATNFPVPILGLIVFGVLIFLYEGLPHRLLFLFFMLVANANYFAFLPTIPERAFQWRFLWPITLSVFFGAGVWAMLRTLRRWVSRPIMEQLFIGAVCVFVIGLFAQSFHNLDPKDLHPLITPERYAAFQWVAQNVPPDQEVLLLYGDGYLQHGLALKHLHAIAAPESMARLLMGNFSNLTFSVQMPDPGRTTTMVFNGTRMVSIAPQRMAKELALGNHNLCDFDYYVLDTQSQRGEVERTLITFNRQFLERAVEQRAIVLVYQNAQTVVVKNMKRGERCV